MRAGFLCDYKHPDRQQDNIEYQNRSDEIAHFGNQKTNGHGRDKKDTGDDENYLSHMNNIERSKTPVNMWIIQGCYSSFLLIAVAPGFLLFRGLACAVEEWKNRCWKELPGGIADKS